MRKSKTLQLFALEVEKALKKGGTSLVNEVCRHITGPNPKVASFMTAKTVEWALGKAKETVEHTGMIEHEHRAGWEESFTTEQLEAMEAAYTGRDSGSPLPS